MKEVVRECKSKAEGDFLTAGRELKAEEAPNFDAVCFHAQQCVEKLIKALIIEKGAVPPRSHNLVPLSQALSEYFANWNWPIEELHFLNRAAVDYRYPGESADKDEAEEAYQICRKMREELLGMFSAADQSL